MHLYELALPSALQRFTVPQPTRNADHFTAQAAFSPTGELVAAVDKEGVYLYQPPNPTPLAHLPADATYSVQFQPDGHALLTSGSDGVRHWPMTWSADHTELCLGPPDILQPTRGQLVNYFELSLDGQWMVAATKQAVLGFDPENPVEAIHSDARIQSDNRPHLSSDGRLAASFSPDLVKIWNPRTGNAAHQSPSSSAAGRRFSAPMAVGWRPRTKTRRYSGGRGIGVRGVESRTRSTHQPIIAWRSARMGASPLSASPTTKSA